MVVRTAVTVHQKTEQHVVCPVNAAMKDVILTVRRIKNLALRYAKDLKAFVRDWKATLRIMIFHRDEYKNLKQPFQIEDYGEVSVPEPCPCDGRKYFLMFGEEICYMCHEWTGRMKGIDC